MPSDNIPVLSEVFGSTPDIIPYTPTILSDEQLKAIKADLDAMPQIKTLGGKYYDYMLGLMNRSIPGFSDILAQGGTLTKTLQSLSAQELAGQIPQDVVDQITRSTAYQNLGSGIFGGPMGAANQARNLGLTSLDMVKLGIGTQEAAGNAAQRWSNIASALNMNPASFFITPQEQAAMTMQNNLYAQQTAQRAENQKAAPNPVAKGISDTIINLIGAYLGAGKGGGGGGIAPNYFASEAQGGPSGSDMGQMTQNYAAAGSSRPVFGASGYPSAIPVEGYGPAVAPASQYSGIWGSLSNMLGGNLHFNQGG
jgi:hypothetical protein